MLTPGTCSLCNLRIQDIMAKETARYILPIHERIRIMEKNIAIFETNGCETMVKTLRRQLALLYKDQAEGGQRERRF